MSHDISSDNLDFIKTLEIQDIILVESSHRAYKLFQEGTALQVNLSQKEDNAINVVESGEFVVFEISMQIKIYEEEKEVTDENLLLESFAKFGAIYTYENLNGWSLEKVEKLSLDFFRFSAVTHIMAFARQHFYTMINKSGYPRLQLPLVKSALDEEAEIESSKYLQKTESK